MVQSVTIDNNKCIPVNRGRILTLFLKLQGKTPHTPEGAGGNNSPNYKAEHK